MRKKEEVKYFVTAGTKTNLAGLKNSYNKK